MQTQDDLICIKTGGLSQKACMPFHSKGAANASEVILKATTKVLVIQTLKSDEPIKYRSKLKTYKITQLENKMQGTIVVQVLKDRMRFF